MCALLSYPSIVLFVLKVMLYRVLFPRNCRPHFKALCSRRQQAVRDIQSGSIEGSCTIFLRLYIAVYISTRTRTHNDNKPQRNIYIECDVGSLICFLIVHYFLLRVVVFFLNVHKFSENLFVINDLACGEASEKGRNGWCDQNEQARYEPVNRRSN